MNPSLRVQWVACTSSSSSAELREQSRRLCQVEICAQRNAVAATDRMQPSVVVFEFENPDPQQLALLQTVKRLHPSVPILMITSAHNEDLAVWAFRARVWNYLVTPVPLRELKSNLQQLAKISRSRDSVKRQVERPSTMLLRLAAQDHGDGENAAMHRIIEHVRADHTSRLSVATLARECGMSRFSFSRLFRSSFGCSCREYVMRLRIETACKMLEAPRASVTRVAIAAGFTDASYFARIFRKRMRKSPLEYARAARLRPAGQRERHSANAQLAALAEVENRVDVDEFGT